MFNIGNGIPRYGSDGGSGGSGGGFLWAVVAVPQSRTAVAVTALAGIAVCAALFYTTSRGHLKSPWSHRRRKQALSLQQWRNMFTLDGRLYDGGFQFLIKVRSGGVDPSIRAEVWPFLLGVYNLNSSKKERERVKREKRKEYEELRKQCRQILKLSVEKEGGKTISNEDSKTVSNDGKSTVQDTDNSSYEDVASARESISSEDRSPDVEYSDDTSSTLLEGDHTSKEQMTSTDASIVNSESSDSDTSGDSEVILCASSAEVMKKNEDDVLSKQNTSASKNELNSDRHATENFATWQRIIRVDAVRANAEWIPHSPSQASVSEDEAHHFANVVGLKDYEHLEPCRIFHAARLVAILEAYALYDPEIGYCQGMSDLLSPIIAIISEDHEAFWCFVGFMKKARHNFRLDEVGIWRQLNIVSKIIKCKDSRLFKHLEMLQAEDCFFVYRMVVVLFRRELTFEQTICLWEVMWADQAAIRAGIGKSEWSRIRKRVPPTDDLLLYAIAASVLQKRKLIIEKYNSMEEILRECNSMAGQLDIWKLLDDAHDLVVNLHDKIEPPF
ncbi:hypothetical protein JCGZ_26591 [Jatropha curcas]|uniref:Rab-GAP TBC domain-containing protein n=1 Tax=Jatropha curcas TaxID=180498 RepID=A0A067L7Y0_JATCU|nr:GTPase-activating protein gyp7 [Jatropha curcas]KDP43333.1 hypothetical protein JCGZ_26591 [Jatropha curcas]